MRENWIEIELGKISQIYNGNSINEKVKEEKYQVCKIGLNYIGTKDIGFDGVIVYENGVKIPYEEPKFKIAPKNCVLVCSEGGSAGKKTAYTKEDICFGNKLYAIVNKFFVFEGKYVYYYTRYQKFFKSFQNQMNGIIGGVSVKKFSNITIPLAPLLEQKAIVAKIEQLFSELDNGIANLKTAQAKLKIYRQAVLKKAFEGNYPMKKFGEIANIQRGKSKHRPRDDEKLFGGNYPFIQTGEVRAANGKIIKNYSKTYSEFRLSQSKLWKAGTLCLKIAANITETALLGFNACFPDSVVGIESDENLDMKFVNYYIQKIKQEIDRDASATAQKNINVAYLEKLEIPYPLIKEQTKIVEKIESRLSVCDKIEETIETSLAKSEALRQSILKKAFEGKLLSEQELENIKSHPEYESAEELIKRIKKERNK